MDELRPILTAVDADSISDVIEEVYDGWFAKEPQIDWEDFLNRLEQWAHCDLGHDLHSPAIKRIQQTVRKLRRQMGEGA